MGKTSENMLASNKAQASDRYAKAFWLWKWRVLGVSLGTRIRLYEQCAFFLSQNIPVPRMLADMVAVLTPRKRPLRWLLEYWASLKTLDIWDRMSHQVPAIDAVSIRAASMRGDLSKGFRQAHKMLLAQKEMFAAIVMLVVATLPILTISLMIIYQMASKITPMMEKMFRPETILPQSVTSFVAFSNHIVNYGLYYAIGAVVLGVAVLYSLPRWAGTRQAGRAPGAWKGQLRHMLDRYVPPYSLYRAYVSSTLTTAIAGMVEADYPMIDAVREVGAQGSPWMRQHMFDIERGMRVGRLDYGESMVRGGLYADDVEDEILIVSRSGALNAVLPAISDRILAKTITRFKAASGIAGLAVLLLVGAFAAWMILAMFGLTDAYQTQLDAKTAF